MSNRFHNKWHRHNHHSTQNPAEPDSGHDPIASRSDPFQGDFVVNGEVSATQGWFSSLTAISALINVLDIYVSELSGFWAKGIDDSLTVPALVIPGINNITLDGVGLSGNRWARIDGDIEGGRDFWLYGTAKVGSLTAASADICELSACNLHVYGGISAQQLNQAPINLAYQGVATGTSSFTEGTSTSAIGDNSHSEGTTTQAVGDISHAEGQDTIASGKRSHAEGYDTNAIGNNSHAEGSATYALSTNSHAEGFFTHADGLGAHVEGSGTWASNQYTHAEGLDTKSLGGNGSHSEGFATYAIGIASHSEGFGTNAIGNESHAEGSYTIASGVNSHAEGYQTSAVGQMSHAAGYESVALHDYSYVWNDGSFTTLSGVSSISSPFQSMGDHTFNVNTSGGFNVVGPINLSGVLSFDNSTIVTTVTSTGMWLTVSVNGSALAIPLYLY